MSPLPFIVGLTGGIGCGKTTVSNRFAELGVSVVDTDLIAHALTVPNGQAMPALVNAFGPDIQTETGALDRVKMRQLAFQDPEQRQRLESILHPLIFQAAMAACQQSQTHQGQYVLLVVPLLAEAGERYRQICQRILVIDCAETTQIQRVMARNSLAETDVLAMMAAQVSREQRLAIATDTLSNEGGLYALNLAIQKLHEHFQALVAQAI